VYDCDATDAPPRPVTLEEPQDRGAVAARIGAATFTGKGDKERVVALYQDYSARVFGEFNRAQHGATAAGLRHRADTREGLAHVTRASDSSSARRGSDKSSSRSSRKTSAQMRRDLLSGAEWSVHHRSTKESSSELETDGAAADAKATRPRKRSSAPSKRSRLSRFVGGIVHKVRTTVVRRSMASRATMTSRASSPSRQSHAPRSTAVHPE
jgi:hypothetical protein